MIYTYPSDVTLFTSTAKTTKFSKLNRISENMLYSILNQLSLVEINTKTLFNPCYFYGRV